MYNKYKDIFKCIFIKYDRYLNPLQKPPGPFFVREYTIICILCHGLPYNILDTFAHHIFRMKILVEPLGPHHPLGQETSSIYRS
jgi:hypothetical protein